MGKIWKIKIDKNRKKTRIKKINMVKTAFIFMLKNNHCDDGQDKLLNLAKGACYLLSFLLYSFLPFACFSADLRSKRVLLSIFFLSIFSF